MKGWTVTCGIALGVWALGALAHQGVQNPAVMARMNAMSAIADATKTLGDMAKGSVSFDAPRAQAAAQALAEKAADVPGLFEAREDDPKSEALPVIWETFEDFRQKTEEMEAAALALTNVADLGGLRAGMGALGQSCKGCHQGYRK